MKTLTWCTRNGAMKTAFGRSEEATFCNATAALFGNAARIVTSWKVLDSTDYRPTWTYLKKAMLNHWGRQRFPILHRRHVQPQAEDE